MKRHLTTLMIAAMLFAANLIYAQAPNSFNYQAVLRDGSGNLITSGPVDMRFTIRTGTASGTVQYQETKNVTPNQYGLVNHTVGTGTVVSGTMASVTWDAANKFLQVEINIGSGFVNLGTQQLVSVPYAMSSGDNLWTKTGNDISNKNTGKVGIGTSTPATHLEVKSTEANTILRLASTYNGVTKGAEISCKNSSSLDRALQFWNQNTGAAATDRQYQFLNAASSPIVTILNGGYVGIGTNAPRFPLEIWGSSASAPMTTPANETWFNYTSGSLQSGANSTTTNVSAYADQYFASGAGFVSHSDTRLKNITGPSNQAQDLLTLNQIQITDYTMRDRLANNGSFKKVIAQQVEEVYPQAVMNIGVEQYVANLYQLAQSYTANSNNLTFELPKAIEEKDRNDIVEGACIKFYMREKANALSMKEAEGKITAIHGNTYTVVANEAIDAAMYDKMFVYGTKINNVLAVDYEALAMLNISATQELAKQVETLKEQNSMLVAANASLKAELNAVTTSLKADMELVKSQLGIGSQVSLK